MIFYVCGKNFTYGISLRGEKMYNTGITCHKCVIMLEKFLKENWKKYRLNIKNEKSKLIKIGTTTIMRELGLGKDIRKCGMVIGSSLQVLEHMGLIKILERRRAGGKYGIRHTVYIIKIGW